MFLNSNFHKIAVALAMVVGCWGASGCGGGRLAGLGGLRAAFPAIGFHRVPKQWEPEITDPNSPPDSSDTNGEQITHNLP